MLRFVLPVLLVGAGAAGVIVRVRTQITTLGYDHVRLHDRETAVRAEVEKLRVEVAALSSPERIEEEAHRLGLVAARPGQIVRLSDVAAGRAGPVARPENAP